MIDEVPAFRKAGVNVVAGIGYEPLLDAHLRQERASLTFTAERGLFAIAPERPDVPADLIELSGVEGSAVVWPFVVTDADQLIVFFAPDAPSDCADVVAADEPFAAFEVGGTVDGLFAVAEVYQTDIRHVRKGMAATIKSPALSAPVPGTVEEVGQLIFKKDVFGDDPTAPRNARVFKNPENVGFVESVNRGFSKITDSKQPVILLNSDAWVPMGWNERLLAPLTDPDIASVTPMSNNAEICTIPNICQPVDLDDGLGDAIDRCARDLGGDPIPMPTGVGFCMAISARWLGKVPRFDTVFGRGYGEEVDWCQKTAKLGGKHVAQHRLFVEHVGSVSFGKAERDAKISKAGQIVARRYPGFDGAVQDFIQNDPLATARFALAVAWAQEMAQSGLTIFLGHNMGGGAEIVLRREIANEIRSKGAAIVIRVGGLHRWMLELHHVKGKAQIATNDFGEVRGLLKSVNNHKVVYSCGVGDHNPIEIPSLLRQLAENGTLQFRVHDFYACSPSIFLTDQTGRFLGEPIVKPNRHPHNRPDQNTMDLIEWQSAWGKAYNAADEITVFSHDSMKRISAIYPEAAKQVRLRPHKPEILPRLVAGASSHCGEKIGILGNLSPAKGAGALCDLARFDRIL